MIENKHNKYINNLISFAKFLSSIVKYNKSIKFLRKIKFLPRFLFYALLFSSMFLDQENSSDIDTSLSSYNVLDT